MPGLEIRKQDEGLPPNRERPKAPLRIIDTILNNSKHRARSLGRTPSGRKPKEQFDQLEFIIMIIVGFSDGFIRWCQQ